MDFDEYSAQASRSDKIAAGPDKLPLLVFGLNEEAGEIARLMKKSIRNKNSIFLQSDDFKRKLGDVLWYLDAISREVDLELSEVAESNIRFVEERWLAEFERAIWAGTGAALRTARAVSQKIINLGIQTRNVRGANKTAITEAGWLSSGRCCR